jgi:hypothetical protein
MELVADVSIIMGGSIDMVHLVSQTSMSSFGPNTEPSEVSGHLCVTDNGVEHDDICISGLVVE